MKNKNPKQKFNNIVEGQNDDIVNSPFFRNPYTIVGDARPSRTGKSLSMRIKHADGKIHYYTILKTELERMYTVSVDEEILPTGIREYFNNVME